MCFCHSKTTQFLLKTLEIHATNNFLNAYKFACNLPKFANLYFLQILDECLKRCEESVNQFATTLQWEIKRV